MVAVSVAGHRFGVDRIHPVPGRDQRRDPQAVVGLDPDRYLLRVLGMLGDQRVERADAATPSGNRRAASFFPSAVMT